MGGSSVRAGGQLPPCALAPIQLPPIGQPKNIEVPFISNLVL